MSTTGQDAGPPRRWRAALSWALLGQVPPGLVETETLEPAELVAELDRRWPGGLAALRAEIARQRSAGAWPHPVPAELMRGLGPAQFTAALTHLSRVLGVDSVTACRPAERRLDADERRLAAEVPPHHGD